jgi:hypothetical protein
MNKFIKPVGGAVIGVTVPIAIEYGVKGGRIGATKEEPNKGIKISGVAGTVMGVTELGIALAGNAKKIGWPKEPEDVGFMGALGGAKLATSVSILVLDELRKRAAYSFKKKRSANLPIGARGEEGLERETYPVVELVEEV